MHRVTDSWLPGERTGFSCVPNAFGVAGDLQQIGHVEACGERVAFVRDRPVYLGAMARGNDFDAHRSCSPGSHRGAWTLISEGDVHLLVHEDAKDQRSVFDLADPRRCQRCGVGTSGFETSISKMQPMWMSPDRNTSPRGEPRGRFAEPGFARLAEQVGLLLPGVLVRPLVARFVDVRDLERARGSPVARATRRRPDAPKAAQKQIVIVLGRPRGGIAALLVATLECLDVVRPVAHQLHDLTRPGRARRSASE